MKQIVFILFFFMTGTSCLLAQPTEKDIDDLIAKNDKLLIIERNTLYLIDGYYFQANRLINHLLKDEPENINFLYRKGFALLQSNLNHTLAEPFLKKAIGQTSKEYDLFSIEEKNAPIDSYFYYARVLHKNHQFEEAKSYYNKFIELSDENSQLIIQAELMIDQCNIGIFFNESKRRYTIENVGPAINSDKPEFSPVISLDGQSLYFTTRRVRPDSSNIDIIEPFSNLYSEDIYVSRKNENGDWSSVELMDFCEADRNNATVAVSSDQKRIYVYTDDQGNGDIFYSSFEKNEFKKLKPLETLEVNSDAWEPHLTVSANGQIMFFSSDREGGFGGRDLYRMVKLPNGEWSKPQNLGPRINTKYDEDSPFIGVDNKTLYFASNGQKSIGGFDIFVSVMDDEQVWSDPINLGMPVNSAGDDIYYTTTADGQVGYFSSFRLGGFGEKDIYQVRLSDVEADKMAILKGYIIPSNDEDELPDDMSVILTCTDCGYDAQHTIDVSDNGTFFSDLQVCRNYIIRVVQREEQKEIYTESFKTDCIKNLDEIDKFIMLDVNTMSVVSEEQIKEEVVEEVIEEKTIMEDVVEEVKVDTTIFAFPPIYLEYFFAYNKKKIITTEGILYDFLVLIKNQIDNGRDSVIVEIESSASQVPTSSFKNNTELAQRRALNLKLSIEEFISKNPSLKEKVVVSIKSYSVNGPEYIVGTANDVLRYGPYQYVRLRVPGQQHAEEDAKEFRAKDAELKGLFDKKKDAKE